MHLAELQAVLDASLANATPFARDLFNQAVTAHEVMELVNEARQLTVATVSPSGVPHAALVVAGCIDGSIVFTVTPGSTLHRNLESSARVAVTCSRGPGGLMGQGTAHLVGHYDELQGVQVHFRERLRDYTGSIYEFRPIRLFATVS